MSIKRSFESRAARTREALLDAAERLFAERGFEATSLRDVTSRARANLAAVNYHFGSKTGLVRAVFERHFGPLNRERLRRLDQAEAAAGKGGPALESVLRAFFEPSIAYLKEHPRFMVLAGRLHSEPNRRLAGVFLDQLAQLIARYRAALVRALPDVPVAEIFWRMHFSIGAMIHTWCGLEDLEKVSRGACHVGDPGEILDRLVAFCAVGLRAPVRSRRAGP